MITFVLYKNKSVISNMVILKNNEKKIMMSFVVITDLPPKLHKIHSKNVNAVLIYDWTLQVILIKGSAVFVI